MGGSVRMDLKEGTGNFSDFMHTIYYHNAEFGFNVTFIFLSSRLNGAFPIGTGSQ